MLDISELKNWLISDQRPFVVAGPCSAESEEQVISTAKALESNETVSVFRAGIWKPRTRPNCFEGVGAVGLPWLKRVRDETRLKVCTEVANAAHVEQCLKHDIDILWIGARTTANPFSVQEIADSLKGVDIPVMIKNPINADLALWLGAFERIMGAGINKVGAIHRGFSTGEKSKYRNLPKWEIPIEFSRIAPQIPMLCDPSHITGNRDMVETICQRAMDLNMQGLVVETHLNPDKALSDAAQQVTPELLKKITHGLILREEKIDSAEYDTLLKKLRDQIDIIDSEILTSLKHRKSVVEQIAQAKKPQNILPYQQERLNELMNNRIEYAVKLGLDAEYAKKIFTTIHEKSVKEQSEILNDGE